MEELAGGGNVAPPRPVEPWAPLFVAIQTHGAIPVLSATSPEALFVALASWLEVRDHDPEAQDTAEQIVALWKQLHGFDRRPPLN